MRCTAFEFAQELPSGFHFTTDWKKAVDKLRELAEQIENDPSSIALQRVKVTTDAAFDDYTMTHVHIEFAERKKHAQSA